MNLFPAIPLELRLVALFLVGLCLGSLLNYLVDRLSWTPRQRSPWRRPDEAAPPRTWQDRLPVIGWLGLRREVQVHGRGFWIRPMAVELLCGFGLAALYWWEVGCGGLIPQQVAGPLDACQAAVHVRFLCHVLLAGLMIVASLIDIDEKIIPDGITVPGTLMGLLAAALWPGAMLPVAERLADGRQVLSFIHLTSPNPWPSSLDGYPRPWPLAGALACWWIWCFALMPRTWYRRHGLRRAVQLMVARLVRHVHTYRLALMGLLGSAAIAVVWRVGLHHWAGLLSALAGIAAGGGIVWAVRVIGTRALGREAMGFGDVTLMGMIGTYLGWQACLVVFFLAPFAGLLCGVVNLLVRRDGEIPYGPFLCLAALAVIVCWRPLWRAAEPYFGLGWWVPVVILLCLAMMAVLLGLIAFLKRALGAGQ